MPLVMERPTFPPHVCLICGMGSYRKWFVDLQLPIDNYFNPVMDGACYLCNECWDSIAVETAKQAQILLLGTEPWKGAEYIEPTYDDSSDLISAQTMKDKLDLVQLEPAPVGNTGEENGTKSGLSAELSLGGTKGTDISAPTDDRPTERNDTPPEPNNTDEQTEPVREFRNHFGV